MSCNTYVHNDPTGGSKYISGTTCSGTEAYYTLTLGQSVCFNDNLPLINECGLVISGSCFAVTPTPTTTPYEYCYFSSFTYNSVSFSCDNGSTVFNVYGVFRFYATIQGVIVSSHPDLSFVLSNGTDFETVVIPDGQEYTEFVYAKVLHDACGTTNCTPTVFPDWIIYTPPVTNCLLFTPTPTITPTNTPTQTSTQTQTPTNTATNTQTQTQTPTNTQTSTQTPTNTQTPTQTQTQTQTPSPTANPVCPETLDFYYSGVTTEYTGFTGTYTRTYSYTGGTFTGGYMNYNSSTTVYNFVTGADPSGKLTAIFTRFAGGIYYTIIPTAVNGGNIIAYSIYQTNINYIFNGQSPLPFAVGLDDIINSPTVGGITFPRQGDNDSSPSEYKLITYPISCPTPTPTNSSTPTPTPTNLPFSPANIPDLFQWFDAASASTFDTRISGGTTYVTSWTGVTGSTVRQLNTSLQPQLIQGLYGLPYSGVSFSGTGIYLTGSTSGTTPSGNTTFIVSYAPNDTNALEFSIDTSDGNGISSQYVNANVVDARTVGRRVQFNGWQTRNKYPYSLMVVSGNTAAASGVLNDTTPSNTSNTFTYGATMTGIRMSDVAADTQGAIYEIIVYNRILTSTEINNVKSYLEVKWSYSTWGITPTPTQTPTISLTPSNTPTPPPTQTPTITRTPDPTPTAVYNHYRLNYVAPGGSCASYNIVDARTLDTFSGNRWICGTYNGVDGYKFQYDSTIAPANGRPLITKGIASNVSCNALTCP